MSGPGNGGGGGGVTPTPSGPIGGHLNRIVVQVPVPRQGQRPANRGSKQGAAKKPATVKRQPTAKKGKR